MSDGAFRRFIFIGLAVLVGWCGPVGAMEVPKDLAGRYAPRGDCTREPRLTVDTQGILVQYGGKQSKLAPVDVCLSCAGGVRYQGIEVQIGPQTNGGPQPFVFRFNANEKRGTVIIEKLDKKVPPIVTTMVAGSPYLRCRGS